MEETRSPAKRFAQLVRKAREKRELSQAVVAQLIKVGPDVIQRIESGDSAPNINLVADLTVLFELPLMSAVYGQTVAKRQTARVGDD